MINEIASEDGLRESVEVIRGSFITVATDFGLGEKTCPTHPAFISLAKLKELKEKGVKTFGLFHDSKQIGFVAIEKSDDALYYMEKLSVLPEYRHKGMGKLLIDFVFGYVAKRNGDKVSIGIIDKNTMLKNWYRKYGFVETGVKRFEHLPFLVCFMEKKVD